MRYFILCVLSVCFLGNSFAQGPLSFPEEHIDFSLDSQYFTINGIYTFKSNSEKPLHQNISFPFAGNVSDVDSIRIVNITQGSNIKFIRYSRGIIFPLAISGMDSIDVNIYYRQKTKKVNTYIITSTQSWGTPLKTAYYTLTVSKLIEIDSFSYKPDSVKGKHADKIYYWYKHNFMPDKEFEVTIK